MVSGAYWMRRSRRLLGTGPKILGITGLIFNDLSFYEFTSNTCFWMGDMWSFLLYVERSFKGEPHQTDSLKMHKKVGMVVLACLDVFAIGKENDILKIILRGDLFLSFIPTTKKPSSFDWLFFLCNFIFWNLDYFFQTLLFLYAKLVNHLN